VPQVFRGFALCVFAAVCIRLVQAGFLQQMPHLTLQLALPWGGADE
jgi:hypothetical protein